MISVIGIGEVPPFNSAGDRTALDVMVEASRDAVLDARLELGEVDGLLVGPLVVGAPIAAAGRFAGVLGLRPSYLDLVDLGGATGCAMVGRAAAAIAAGLCRAVLCVMGDTVDPGSFYTPGPQWAGDPEVQFERPYGSAMGNSGYALVAQRHAYEFGTTDMQRAFVAFQQRQNARLHPTAIFRDRGLTVEEVLASPLVADPLHLLEIVRPCGGAIAFVVAAADVADGAGPPAVGLAGYAERFGHNLLTEAPSLTSFAIADTASRAFKAAGLSPSDMDVLSLYDCYTITVIVTLEDAGFCRKGDGGPFVAERTFGHDGDLPLNTHGGQLSYGQAGVAGGASHLLEAVVQLRGQAEQRQVRDCEHAFVQGNGGLLSEQVSVILRRHG